MKWQQYITGFPTLIVTFFVMLLGIVPCAYAVDQVSVDNLQAAVRTLSFLESLPKEGTIIVGVVYPSDIPSGEALATQTAKVIGTMRGPNSRMLHPIIVSTN